MVGVEQIEIERPVDLSVIETRIRELDADTKKLQKVRDRLQFIRLRYKGYSVSQACDICQISLQTGYNWQDSWNERGMDSLSPNYGGGRPAAMSPEERERFKEAVDRDKMTTAEAGAYLKDVMGFEFTPKHVRSMLRSMGFRHAKPYDIDYRRPEDAEAALKKDSTNRWTL